MDIMFLHITQLMHSKQCTDIDYAYKHVTFVIYILTYS